MAMNPDTHQFEPIPQELMEKFNRKDAVLTPHETKMRDWTRFEEGETVTLKGIAFNAARSASRGWC